MSFKLLIIEDQPDVAEMLRQYLGELGYKVDIAGTGAAALAKTRRSAFDLVITDYKLPDIDGVTLVNKIRRDVPRIKVLYVTGYSPEMKGLSRAKGDFLLEKPCRPKQILQMVQQILMSK